MYCKSEDWVEGKVPEDFVKNLFKYYRDYLDEKGKVISGREKHLQAWIYFVGRILPSVNSEINDYSAVPRKTKLLRNCFTSSDEAFALVMVLNYVESWIRKIKAKESKIQAARMGDDEQAGQSDGEETPAHLMPKEWFHARWTGSQDGNKLSGWDEEGIEEFNKHADKINKLRAGEITGEKLETHLRDHWSGMLRAPNKRPKKKMKVKAYVEEMFGKYAEV